MDDYTKEPSDAFTRFKAGEIDRKEYLDETQDDVIEVLVEQASAQRERAEERERVDGVLHDPDSG